MNKIIKNKNKTMIFSTRLRQIHLSLRQIVILSLGPKIRKDLTNG